MGSQTSLKTSQREGRNTLNPSPGSATGGIVVSGAPNENIVQNHLNIALLNVF